MNWHPADPQNRLEIKALLFFGATSSKWDSKPDPTKIISSIALAALPAFLWVLLVIDRENDRHPHVVTFDLVRQGGGAVGTTHVADVDNDVGPLILVNWHRRTLQPAIQEAGSYLGRLFVDGVLFGTSRLSVTS